MTRSFYDQAAADQEAELIRYYYGDEPPEPTCPCGNVLACWPSSAGGLCGPCVHARRRPVIRR